MLSLHVCFRYQSWCADGKEFMKISTIFIILSPTKIIPSSFFSLIFFSFFLLKRYCIAAQHIPLRMLQKQIHFLCNNFLWKSQRHRLMTTIHQHQIYIQKKFTEEGRLRHFFLPFFLSFSFSRSSKNYIRSTSNSKIKIPEQRTTLIEFFIASGCAKSDFFCSRVFLLHAFHHHTHNTIDISTVMSGWERKIHVTSMAQTD